MEEQIETKLIQETPEPIQKEEEKVENVLKCPVLTGISKELQYAISTPEQIKKKQDQDRTVIKKRMFLEYWAKSKGVISAVCEKIEVDVRTFRRWRKNDIEFTKELDEVTEQRREDIEDMLMGKIFVTKDGPSIRYWLDRKHPEYKPKMVNEIFDGKRTLDDIIAERRAKVKKAQEEYDKKHTGQEAGTTNKQGADRGAIDDKKQEGDSGAVPVQHSPELLLEKDDAPKPDTESAPKGDQ